MKTIYVDVDSLRPDHTGAYGYGRNITPNLDAMARDSVVFDRYYCSDSPCPPSRTALTSGQHGITNGVIGRFGDDARFRLDAGHALHPFRPLLGQGLNMAGYTCAAVSSFAERHRAYYSMGNFRENVQVTPDLGDEPADMITDAAVDWIEKHRDMEDWCLHVTYWDPHTDFLQDESWTAKAAASGPAPVWPDQQAIDGHAEVYGARSALDLHYSAGPRKSRVQHNMPDDIRTRADFEHLINGYDAAIHFWDSEFGRPRRSIEELGLADEVAIVVASDHGVSFGELGLYAEHGLASEPVHRLPMIVHWPGITDQPGVAATRNDALLHNLDDAQTILDLLGITQPEKWQGKSYAPAVRGGYIESRPYLVWVHSAHTYQRAVRTRGHLYVRTFQPGCFRAEPESLFNVIADPYLTKSLIDIEPDLAAQMRSNLMEWLGFYAGTPGALPDPMQGALQVGPTLYNRSGDYMEHLCNTGRGHLAEHLSERLNPGNGAAHVSWHAQVSVDEADREARRKRFAASIMAQE